MSKTRVTIELEVATASVLLSELLNIEKARSYPLLYTRDWHLDEVRDALKAALLAWPDRALT